MKYHTLKWVLCGPPTVHTPLNQSSSMHTQAHTLKGNFTIGTMNLQARFNNHHAIHMPGFCIDQHHLQTFFKELVPGMCLSGYLSIVHTKSSFRWLGIVLPGTIREWLYTQIYRTDSYCGFFFWTTGRP